MKYKKGGWFSVYAGVPFWRVGLLLKFCLTEGSLFRLKSALQQGPFLLKIEVSPLKMHDSLTSTAKIFESLLNGTF